MERKTMTCEQARELITGCVDDQLSAAERSALDDHFKDCTRCRFLLAQEKNLKNTIHAAGSALRAPSSLTARLAKDPRIAGRSASLPIGPGSKLARSYPLLRGALIAALLLLVIVPPLWLARRSQPPLAIAALRSSERIFSADSLQIRGADLRRLADQLAQTVDGNFRPMAYDFSMMHIRPVGGSGLAVDGRRILVISYRGPDQAILCYTLIGTEADAPPGAAIFYDAQKQLNFYAFSLGNVNAVLHRENDVICILVSPMAMTDLLELAKSKANPHKHL